MVHAVRPVMWKRPKSRPLRNIKHHMHSTATCDRVVALSWVCLCDLDYKCMLKKCKYSVMFRRQVFPLVCTKQIAVAENKASHYVSTAKKQ